MGHWLSDWRHFPINRTQNVNTRVVVVRNIDDDEDDDVEDFLFLYVSYKSLLAIEWKQSSP